LQVFDIPWTASSRAPKKEGKPMITNETLAGLRAQLAMKEAAEAGARAGRAPSNQASLFKVRTFLTVKAKRLLNS
jgi:hypothetical protein